MMWLPFHIHFLQAQYIGLLPCSGWEARNSTLDIITFISHNSLIYLFCNLCQFIRPTVLCWDLVCTSVGELNHYRTRTCPHLKKDNVRLLQGTDTKVRRPHLWWFLYWSALKFCEWWFQEGQGVFLDYIRAESDVGSIIIATCRAF